MYILRLYSRYQISDVLMIYGIYHEDISHFVVCMLPT